MSISGAGGPDLQILGMTIEPWLLLGLLAFSVIITLFTNWAVAGFRRPAWPRLFSLGDVVTVIASLIWLLLITAAGVLATRYIERMRSAALGYFTFGLGVLLLSLVRAFLYRRLQEQEKQQSRIETRSQWQYLVHHASYVLFALALYLALSWFLDRPARPILFLPLCFGALLPDLDSHDSVLGRLLPFISRPLEARLGHGQQWHSLASNSFIALITAPLVPLIGLGAWYVIPLAFFSHLVLDMLTPQGPMLFWPLTDTRYRMFGGPIKSPGDRTECRLAASLAIACASLLLVVDVGPPKPTPMPSLSYTETIERYYALRGRNLVFADVEGTWQATGRRMSGRFEILNAADESLIMLDRYDGKVFAAGRSASDNLYLNRITLQPGSPVHVKPAEIHLQDEPLAEALPVLYQMQREPGLQHIYISGDVIMPALSDLISPTLPIEYAQTSLQRIQAQGPGHYRLNYLTASELIALSNQRVSTADLVIVATYATPPAGPTVTPLPSTPTTPEAGP